MTKLRLVFLVLAVCTCTGAFAQTAPTANSLPPSPSAVPPNAPTSAQPAGFFYYCDRLKAYYPTAPSCPEGWIAIPVGSPPPMAERRWRKPEPPETAETVKTRPNALTLELFGRAVVYSLDYDRAISEHITLGLGLSYWRMTAGWASYQSTVAVMPLYANYYFTQWPSRGYLSLGMDLIKVSQPGYDTRTFNNNGVAGVVGGGYEYRHSSGFMIRLGGYLIVGRSVSFDPSANFGIGF